MNSKKKKKKQTFFLSLEFVHFEIAIATTRKKTRTQSNPTINAFFGLMEQSSHLTSSQHRRDNQKEDEKDVCLGKEEQHKTSDDQPAGTEQNWVKRNKKLPGKVLNPL